MRPSLFAPCPSAPRPAFRGLLGGWLLALALLLAQWVGLGHALSHGPGARAVAATTAAVPADAPAGQAGGEVCERCLAFMAMEHGVATMPTPVPPAAWVPAPEPALPGAVPRPRVRLSSSRDPPPSA